VIAEHLKTILSDR